MVETKLGSGPIKSLALAAVDWFNSGTKEVLPMSELWLLSEAQMRRIEAYFSVVAWDPAGR